MIVYTHKKSTELLMYFPTRGVWRNPTDRNNQKPVLIKYEHSAIILIGL